MCQPFNFFIFFWLLQVYYFDNLLCDVSVPVGVPRCHFFTSEIIENISKADRDLSKRGFVTYGKLPVSNCF